MGGAPLEHQQHAARRQLGAALPARPGWRADHGSDGALALRGVLHVGWATRSYLCVLFFPLFVFMWCPAWATRTVFLCPVGFSAAPSDLRRYGHGAWRYAVGSCTPDERMPAQPPLIAGRVRASSALLPALLCCSRCCQAPTTCPTPPTHPHTRPLHDAAFCWHVEDHALCSINYLHMGAPKVLRAEWRGGREVAPGPRSEGPVAVYRSPTVGSAAPRACRQWPRPDTLHKPIPTQPPHPIMACRCGMAFLPARRLRWRRRCGTRCRTCLPPTSACCTSWSQPCLRWSSRCVRVGGRGGRAGRGG